MKHPHAASQTPIGEALGRRGEAALDPLAEEVDEISRMLYTLRRKVEREP